VPKCIRGNGGCGGGGGSLICACATVKVHAVITAINNTLMIFIMLIYVQNVKYKRLIEYITLKWPNSFIKLN
jgi:hypothetical protein